MLSSQIDSLNRVLQTEKNLGIEKTATISDLNSKVLNLEAQLSKLNVELDNSKEKSDKTKGDIKSLQNQIKIKADSIIIVRNEIEKIQSSTSENKSNQNIVQKEYKSIKYKSQIWMAENLDVATFKNGDPIQEVKTVAEWKKAGLSKQPAWCYYDNDPKNGEKYGKLYNWYAVNDPRGLAPEGWRISTDEDWLTLGENLGGDEQAGYYLKSTTGWDDDGNGVNSIGFNSIPSGFRLNDGLFYSLNSKAYYWTSTINSNGPWTEFFKNNPSKAWCRYIAGLMPDIFPKNDLKEMGFAVRCVK